MNKDLEVAFLVERLRSIRGRLSRPKGLKFADQGSLKAECRAIEEIIEAKRSR